MRAVAYVNKYSTDTAPWTLKGDEQRERLGTVLHVLAQCVTDLNLVLSPFLPFSANAVDVVYGGDGDVPPMPETREPDALHGGPGYPINTRDSTTAPPRARHPLEVGTPTPHPHPVFV